MKSNFLQKFLTTSLAFAMCITLISPGTIYSATTEEQASASTVKSAVPDKVLVGYWHNFENGTGTIKLRDVSPDWDVINLSFGEGTSVTSGDIRFEPFNASKEEFKADVEYLQSQGKKVLISIGGEKGQVQLKDEAAKNNFINSVSNIIDTYGLDGLDIDFEGHSLYFNPGDKDFKNPTTPVIVNLIDALHQLSTKYGDDFVLTMAPETFFVQNGRTFYGGINSNVDSRCGAYLPVIYALRDELDWLQVQYYNSGPINDINGKTQNMGNAEFYTALADMLLTGFPVNNDPNNMFPPLRADQVVIGVPACSGAGNGWATNAEVQKAFDALVNGGTVGGYTVSEPHPDLRGLMSWSINWDKYNKFAWTTHFRKYLDELSPPVSTLKEASLSSSEIKDGNFTLTADIPSRNTATSYKIFEDNKEIYKGTLTPEQPKGVSIKKEITNKPNGIYEYKVVVYDGSNNSATSNILNLDTTPPPNSAPVLKGVFSKEITKGKSFNSMDGVTAFDKEDGDVTSNITVSGSVNTNVIGSYNLTYTIIDSEGTKSESTIVIIVTEKEILTDTYDKTKIYSGGEIVVYNGIQYKCKWWSQGDIPGVADVWQKIEKLPN